MRFNINILFGILFCLIVFLVLNIAVFSDNSFMATTTTILVMIFGGLALSVIVKEKVGVEESIVNENKKELIQDLAHNVIFSLQSLDAKLEKALYSTHKLLKSQGIYTGILEEDQVYILKQKYSSDELSIGSYVNLKKPSLPLEKAISTFFKSNENIHEVNLKLEDGEYKSFFYPLITKSSLDSFGFFMVLYKENQKVSPQMMDKMKFMAEAISFAVNIAYKKDALMQINMSYYQKFNEIDENLQIFNENKIQKTIKNEFDRFKRYLTPLSIILFEIDDIKNISNVLTEEELLSIKKEFSQLVKTNIRQTDIFGVWKEDIYAIITQNVDYQGARVVVNKLIDIIKRYKFYKINLISCSYGITGFSQKDSPELFQERAYDALLKAKDKGGDGVEIQILV